MASTGEFELRSQGYQVLRKHWENTGRDDEIDQKFRNNESMQCVRRLQVDERFRNGRKSKEKDSRDGPPCVVKMTMKDITF